MIGKGVSATQKAVLFITKYKGHQYFLLSYRVLKLVYYALFNFVLDKVSQSLTSCLFQERCPCIDHKPYIPHRWDYSPKYSDGKTNFAWHSHDDCYCVGV